MWLGGLRKSRTRFLDESAVWEVTSGGRPEKSMKRAIRGLDAIQHRQATSRHLATTSSNSRRRALSRPYPHGKKHTPCPPFHHQESASRVYKPLVTSQQQSSQKRARCLLTRQATSFHLIITSPPRLRWDEWRGVLSRPWIGPLVILKISIRGGVV